MPTMTAAQRRAEARAAYEAYLESCPARTVLDGLSEKWASLVLLALADGPLRHSALARAIAGASQKMLTQTLRNLERDGLVSRAVTPSVPARVDYALTPLGVSLIPVVETIRTWSDEHIAEVRDAREAFEARTDTQAA